MHGSNMLAKLETTSLVLKTALAWLGTNINRAPVLIRGRFIYLVPIFISLLLLNACVRPDLSRRTKTTSPLLFLWAWERKEDLHFINPETTGVAYLANRISLQETGITEYQRQQPLILPAHTKTIAVVRLEMKAKSLLKSKYGVVRELPDTLIDKIVSLCASPDCLGLQVDFDARLSERQFYRSLLAKLRAKLPADKMLSMTALASWVFYDDWIYDLPVNEFVPMFFEMGPDTDKIMSRLKQSTGLSGRIKHISVGLSTNELFRGETLFKSKTDILNAGTRLYLFCRQPWTIRDYQAALKEVSLWH